MLLTVFGGVAVVLTIESLQPLRPVGAAPHWRWLNNLALTVVDYAVLLGLTPRPRRAYLLDVTPAQALVRKPEESLAYLNAQVAAYRRAAPLCASPASKRRARCSRCVR